MKAVILLLALFMQAKSLACYFAGVRVPASGDSP
jgi:hypothetical protein